MRSLDTQVRLCPIFALLHQLCNRKWQSLYSIDCKSFRLDRPEDKRILGSIPEQGQCPEMGRKLNGCFESEVAEALNISDPEKMRINRALQHKINYQSKANVRFAPSLRSFTCLA